MNVKGFLLALGIASLSAITVTACSSSTTSTTSGGNKDGGTSGDDDDDDTGSTGSAQAQCVKVCEAAADLKCENDETSNCASDCTSDLKQLPAACESDYVDLTKCILGGSLSCDETEGTAVTDADCGTEQDALVACVQKEGGGTGGTCGNISLGDATCDGCIEQQCCDENKACSDSQDCLALITCINDCAANDDACVQSCVQKNPDGAQPLQAFINCFGDKCSTECGAE